LAATQLRLFISSVQKELAEERRAVKLFVENDPLLSRFFTVFLFEDLPASDRRADAVYLAEVERRAVYVGLFGNEYGHEDGAGISPTEREFDQATASGKPRLIFVKGIDDNARQPRMRALIGKAGSQLIRRRFNTSAELTTALNASLVDHLEASGAIQTRPFEERPCSDATLADLDARAVADFVRQARQGRHFPLSDQTTVADVLAHLHLLREDRPTHAALLLFGREPQAFLPAAEVRCMHFHGTEIQRPVPFYRIFKGTLFLARYIEKYGTGTLMMIRESLSHALPEPDFAQRGGEFTCVIWRDWLTTEVLVALALSERQQRAVNHLKTHGRITNSEYQTLVGVSRATASRDLEELLAKRILEKVGKTGRGAHYLLAKKRLTNASNDSNAT